MRLQPLSRQLAATGPLRDHRAGSPAGACISARLARAHASLSEGAGENKAPRVGARHVSFIFFAQSLRGNATARALAATAPSKIGTVARQICQRLLFVALIMLATSGGVARAQDASASTGPSGLQIPRFVSLKADRVNVRKGPSTDHPVSWVFSRAGLPVEVTAESGHWRRVRDSESSEGWVFHSLLSGRRTALIMPWVKSDEPVSLRKSPSGGSDLVARLLPGVLANVLTCDGAWCHVSVDEYTGWLKQDVLWGVYRGETLK